jgi:hypothetical protein
MMAYNSDLDHKIQHIVNKDHMLRKTMFGGTCYLIKNKMVCGVWQDYIILRLGEAQALTALKQGKARVFDITGKPMKGWVMIQGDGLTSQSMTKWVGQAKSFVISLK